MELESLLIINPKLKDMLREEYPHLDRYLKTEEFSDTESLLLNKYSFLNAKRSDAEKGLYDRKFEREEEDLFNDIVRYMKKHKIEF